MFEVFLVLFAHASCVGLGLCAGLLLAAVAWAAVAYFVILARAGERSAIAFGSVGILFFAAAAIDALLRQSKFAHTYYALTESHIIWAHTAHACGSRCVNQAATIKRVSLIELQLQPDCIYVDGHYHLKLYRQHPLGLLARTRALLTKLVRRAAFALCGRRCALAVQCGPPDGADLLEARGFDYIVENRAVYRLFVLLSRAAVLGLGQSGGGARGASDASGAIAADDNAPASDDTFASSSGDRPFHDSPSVSLAAPFERSDSIVSARGAVEQVIEIRGDRDDGNASLMMTASSASTSGSGRESQCTRTISRGQTVPKRQRRHCIGQSTSAGDSQSTRAAATLSNVGHQVVPSATATAPAASWFSLAMSALGFSASSSSTRPSLRAASVSPLPFGVADTQSVSAEITSASNSSPAQQSAPSIDRPIAVRPSRPSSAVSQSGVVPTIKLPNRGGKRADGSVSDDDDEGVASEPDSPRTLARIEILKRRLYAANQLPQSVAFGAIVPEQEQQ